MPPEDQDTPRPKPPNRLFALLTRFFVFLERLAPRVLGDLSYQAPPWVQRLKGRLAPLARRAKMSGAAVTSRLSGWRKHRPKRFWGTVAGTLLVILAGLGGYRWYRSRPRPLEFTVTGTEPGLTKIAPDAVPDPVHLYFSGSAAPLDRVGKTVNKGIAMKPLVAGTWKWASDRDLLFTPSEDWGIGQTYTVRMDKSLFPKHVRLNTYEYSFHSKPFSLSIDSSEFYQDPKQPKVKQVVATVGFSHVVDSADFEKRIHFTFSSTDRTGLIPKTEPYRFTVSYQKDKAKAFIHSEIVPIPWREAQMKVEVDAGVRAARGGAPAASGASTTVNVPGMYDYFRVTNLEASQVRNAQYEPEQVLILSFSAGVHSDEVAKSLEVYVLPVDRPKGPDREAVKNYAWNSPEEIGADILKLSPRVPLDPIPTELEFSTLHTFRYRAPVGRYLYAKVKKGAKSYGDYILADDFAVVRQVPPFPQELKIMHDGAILSLSGSHKLSVLARDLQAIQFEIGRVLPGQVNHLITQTEGAFASPSFRNYGFNEDNIDERFTTVTNLAEVEEGKTQYSAVDFTSYLLHGGQARHGLFFLKAQSWDPENKVPGSLSDRRFVLVTDLGMVVKDNKDATHEIFVQSLFAGQPTAGATVDVLGKNGIPVASAVTDAEGHAHFPSLKGLDREKRPTVYVARKGEDFSFLPFKRDDRRLDFSRFDVGGEVSDVTGSVLTAYLFSDRGIYRPGDEFHIGMIVKSSDWRQKTAGVPLEEVITDPRGIEIFRRKTSLSGQGFEELAYRTDETSPTGSYGVQLYIVKDGNRGSLLGSTQVRVEEFLPDRMRITTHFSQERLDGWVSPKDLKAKVRLQTLFGIAAAKRKIVAEVDLTPSAPFFRPFKDYTFFDPLRSTKSFNESLGSQDSDENGEAEFDLNLDRFEGGTYRVRFIAEGHEAEGGRAVSAESVVMVSPLTYLVGIKPDGDLHYVSMKSERSIKLVAVSPEMKQVAVDGLKAHLIELRYVSTLVKQENDTYKYQSVRKEVTVSKKPLSLTAAGNEWRLPTDKAGDFMLVIRDENERELNRVEYTVVGEANLTRNLEKNAELQVKLNKPDYSPGEEIELQILAPYTGAGLITVEREKVYAHQWFRTTTTSSIQHIRLPPGVEGNAYVSVTFVRAIDSKEIFMSPLSYAVQPFFISLKSRVNHVTLEVPDRARPGEPFPIRYRTERPGKLVIFAVDEGILQVARYQNPDPLGFFFRKRALEVKTSQILDLLLPEFEMVKATLAPGGGEGEAAIGKNLNPFKRKREAPVAFWSGILSSTGAPGQLVYHVPDYFSGTLRVIAVAVAPDSLGVETKKSFIKGPFVISPNVPVFVAPGDKFQVSVSVANNVEGSGPKAPIEVSVEPSSAALEVQEKSWKQPVDEGKEETIQFQVTARNVLGSAGLKFVARLGEKRSHYSTDLSVRPPMPYYVTLDSGSLRKGTREIPVTRKMYPQFRTQEIALSVLPLGLSSGLLAFLDGFPYGCTEQLVSKAFPALVLRQRPEFGVSPAKTQRRLDETIAILRARQNEEGAFGIWASNSSVSDFQNAYAAHFLTEAKEAGYAVPRELLDKELEYLKTIAGRDASSPGALRVASYAIYILTRNGIVTTSYVSELRRRLDRGAVKGWQKDLVGLYLAATYQLLQQRSEAGAIMGQVKVGDPQQVNYEDYYDGLVRDAQLVYLMARHFPDRLRTLGGDDLQHLLDPISSGSYNTVNSAYAILALAAYTGTLAGKGALNVNAWLAEIRADKKRHSLVIPKGLFPKVPYSDQAEKLSLANRSDLNLFYVLTQAGFDLSIPAEELKQKLEVQREYRDAEGKAIAEVTLGEEAEVHLKVRSLGGEYSNIAFVDLLPGGFEVVRESLRRSPPPGNDSSGEAAAGEGDETGGQAAPPEEGEAGEGADSGEREAPPDESQDGAQNTVRRRTTQAGFTLSKPADNGAPATGAKPDGSTEPLSPESVDIREDRVVAFGGVSAEVRELVYRIRATNRGNFVVPPPFAESMYDRSVRARGRSASILVK